MVEMGKVKIAVPQLPAGINMIAPLRLPPVAVGRHIVRAADRIAHKGEAAAARAAAQVRGLFK